MHELLVNLHNPSRASVGWERKGGGKSPPPNRTSKRRRVECCTEGAGDDVIGRALQRTGKPKRDRRIAGHALRQLRRAADSELQEGKLNGHSPGPVAL